MYTGTLANKIVPGTSQPHLIHTQWMAGGSDHDKSQWPHEQE